MTHALQALHQITHSPHFFRHRSRSGRRFCGTRQTPTLPVKRYRSQVRYKDDRNTRPRLRYRKHPQRVGKPVLSSIPWLMYIPIWLWLPIVSLSEGFSWMYNNITTIIRHRLYQRIVSMSVWATEVILYSLVWTADFHRFDYHVQFLQSLVSDPTLMSWLYKSVLCVQILTSLLALLSCGPYYFSVMTDKLLPAVQYVRRFMDTAVSIQNESQHSHSPSCSTTSSPSHIIHD